MKRKEKIIRTVTKKLRKSQASTLAVEEISELITEIQCHISGANNYEDLCEEIADTVIMTNLFMESYQIPTKKVIRYMIENKDAFYATVKSYTEKMLFQRFILDLANLQKVICKKARKRNNTKMIVSAIGSCFLYVSYLQDTKTIKKKDYKKWERMKMKRMRARAAKNQII